MSERLIIKHFGPIPELDIEIKKITLFIGTQGSGKSTISKLLTAFRDIFWRINILKKGTTPSNEENDFIDVFKHFQSLGIERYFNANSYIEYTDKDIKITYQNGNFDCDARSTTKEQLIEKYQREIFASSQNVLQQLGFADLDVRQMEELDMRMFLETMRTLLYIPAERIVVGQLSTAITNIMLSRIPLADVLLAYMSFFEKAKKEFPEYNIPFLNAVYKIADGKESVVVSTDGQAKELPLAVCSSGLQSVIPMLMIIEYCTKVHCFDSFVVEEPEQGLFPTNQIELLKFLLSKVYSGESMVITTHSPYLLSAMNNYLYAGELSQKDGIDKKALNNIVPENLQLDVHECAVYALNNGEDKPYCQSIISEETGLIDFNYLDAVSFIIDDEFGQLQDIDLSAMRN